jgi:soluble epoxide hydrolase / lipid-phosphate phosphatase
MPAITVTEHTVKTAEHTTFYLAAGPSDGPLMIFLHGWPELAVSWRHQLPFFAAMGFRAIAPDMRGYGRSQVHPRHEDYQNALIVADMLALLASLGQQDAIWVGHDLGSPIAWSLASHHPQHCRAVASLCVPYATVEYGLERLLELVDRDLYPAAEFPAGQWEYMRFYEDHFSSATGPMDANPRNMIQTLFRRATNKAVGQRSATANVYHQRGWFGGAAAAPEYPRDPEVLSIEDLHAYASALERNGFFGPNSWYMNHRANRAYARQAPNAGQLALPVLFLGARYDSTCETTRSRLTEPMLALCSNLSQAVLDTGHWMAQEDPAGVNRELVKWLVKQVL